MGWKSYKSISVLYLTGKSSVLFVLPAYMLWKLRISGPSGNIRKKTYLDINKPKKGKHEFCAFL
jgi:hypothetical protein